MAKAYDNFNKDFTFQVIDSFPHQKPDVHKFHIVKKGDTLSKIAVEHGTTVTILCKLNNMKKTDILRIGRKIRVR